jgi:imidazolonepropionase-like amidohydrolase
MLFVLICFALRAPASAAQQVQPNGLYIKGGWYFDVERSEMVRNEGIVVAGGKFYEVGTSPSGVEQHSFEVIQLNDDEYILPGLVDLHAHYRMEAFGNDDQRWVDEFKYNAIVYLANGVTTTFPAGVYYPELELAAKKRINSGEMIGPRLLASGPYFGTARPGWNNEATREEIYREVDYWAARGVDGFKAKGARPEHVKYLVERAHQHGLTVTGHLGSGSRNSTNSKLAIELGIDRVEHILGGHALDPERPAYPVWNQVDTTDTDFKKIVRHFIEHGVNFDATITAPVYFTTLKEGFDYWAGEREFFTPYVQQLVSRRGPREPSDLMDGLYETMRRTTKAFYDAGGGHLITLGTDAPSHGEFLPGFGAHRELHTMVLAGIPEADVLKIGTINSARAIGKGDLLGSIETGKLADFFVVQGNPLDDITNTRNVRLVVKGGERYDPEKLLQSVRGKIGPAGKEEVDDWFRYEELTGDQEREG